MSSQPTKTRVVAVRFSPEDYERLEEQAKKEGLSLSTHVRRLILLVLSGDMVEQRQANYAKSKGWDD